MRRTRAEWSGAGSSSQGEPCGDDPYDLDDEAWLTCGKDAHGLSDHVWHAVASQAALSAQLGKPAGNATE